ncbi:MAG: response regulator [Candidatus Krumholzibacteria bacterium]|nr:response regulator [Candidatus Krumholzibacteria bacterium]
MTSILVVDDSALDRRIAGEVIEQKGATATYAENGQEALDKIERDEPDVVLTDLQMPEMDGLQLVERIRKDHPRVPVILMTAYGSEDVALAALKAGAASYVPKKNLKQELDEALWTVMSAIEARQHREQVREFLERSESHFVLGYETDGPTALVGHLQDGLAQLDFCDELDLFRVSTALAEAIRNAIDHGNLELDSALREQDDHAYPRLGRDREQQQPYRDRRVYVTAKLTASEATYVVRDEGSGFDPSQLPDPKDPENLVKASGRGVMLIRTFMDHVTFNKIGNEITMVKRRTGSPPT